MADHEQTRPITILQPAQAQLTSPLLSLPREIRDIIYFYFFEVAENWIRLDTAGPLDAPLFSECCSPLDDSHAMRLYGLIVACRQTYHETMDKYYYPTSIFYLYNFNAALRRIARMPARYRAALTDVRVCMSPRMIEEVKGLIGGTQGSNETSQQSVTEKWKKGSLAMLSKGLDQAGLALRDGVLKLGSAPACFDEEDEHEYVQLTALFGQGPTSNRWRGTHEQEGLARQWSQRTSELTRYQSVIKHAVDLGAKGERMRCWAETPGLDM